MFSNLTASSGRPLEHRGCSPVPVFAPELTVRREEILQRLLPPDDDSKRLRLLLTAPAGFGKTVLAAQLAAALGNRCIWRAVEADDSDPRLLLDSLFYAVQTVMARRGTRQLVWEDLSTVSPARPQIESTVALLVGAIVDAGPDERFTLVLENLHRLDQAPLSRFIVEQVWATFPPWIDLVLTSRTATLVSLTQLGPGSIAHLTEDELRLTELETAALVEKLLGYRADRQTRQTLFAQAGGMPAITAGTILVHGQHGDSRDPLPGDGDLEACYEAVVNALPADLQRRLFQVAGCGLLDGAALGALFGRKIGSGILTALRTSLPFICRLGDSRTYRFVDSFDHYLQHHEACLFQPDRSRRLYRLALYHAAAGTPWPALECASRCCHYGLVNDLLGIFGPQLFAAPDERCLRRAITPIPASVLRAMPWLALFGALLSGDDEQRRTSLLDCALAQFTESDRKDGLLLSLCALTEHHLISGTTTGNMATRIRQLEKLFVYLRSDLPPLLNARIAHLLAIGYCVIFGRTGKTELYLTMASLAEKHDSSGRTAATALVVSALRSAFEADTQALTGALARSSLLLLNETSAPRSFSVLTYVRLKVLVLRGDFFNYRRLAAQLPLDPPHGLELRVLQPYLSMLAGDAALAAGNYREARHLIDQGLLTIDGDTQPHLCGLLLQFKALTLALLQLPEAATEAITRAAVLQSGTAGHPNILLHHQVAAMVWYHLGRFDDGDCQLQRATRLENLIDFPFRWTDARWHQASCLLRADRPEQALTCIAEVLHTFRLEQRRHCLCLVPSVARTVLHTAISADIERAYARELLARHLKLGCDRRGVLVPLLQIALLRHQAVTGADNRRLPLSELTTLERKLLFHLAQATAMRSPQVIAAEELWPEKDPERQRSSLDNLISRLRGKLKALVPSAAAKDYLAIDQGYVVLSLCTVDVIEFLSGIDEAIKLTGQGREWDAENTFARAFAALDETILQPPDFEYLETLQGRFEQRLTDGVAAYAALLGRQQRQPEATRFSMTAFRYCPHNPRLTRICHDLLRRCQDPTGAETVLQLYRQAHRKTTSDPKELIELLQMVFS